MLSGFLPQHLLPELEPHAAAGVPGTLTALAVREGRVGGLPAWPRELGLTHLEVSHGSIALEPARRLQLIAEPSGEGFTVGEVRSEADLGVPPAAVASLETLRPGLRPDTPGMAR